MQVAFIYFLKNKVAFYILFLKSTSLYFILVVKKMGQYDVTLLYFTIRIYMNFDSSGLPLMPSKLRSKKSPPMQK